MRRLQDHLYRRTLTDASLATHLSTLFEAGRSPATASMVVAIMRFQTWPTGSESPVGTTHRSRVRGTGQVAGVQWSQADAAAAGNGGASIHGLRDAAIIAVTSDGMLRVSEMSRAQRWRRSRRRERHGHRHRAPLQDGSGCRRRGAVPGCATAVNTDDVDAPLFQRIDKGGTAKTTALDWTCAGKRASLWVPSGRRFRTEHMSTKTQPGMAPRGADEMAALQERIAALGAIQLPTLRDEWRRL